MIGRIAGRIEVRGPDHVLIDVRGVGYVVFASERTLAGLPGPGEATALFTDLIVREDLLQLYGFSTQVEKEWFRLLMSVQGVGAKAALAILGALGADGVSRAIALGDWNAIKAARGIGPKTGQRVVNELKDKAPVVMAMAEIVAGPPDADALIEDAPARAGAAPGARAPVPAPQAAAHVSAQSEALSALANLGYAPGEAASAIATALNDAPELDTPGLIRAALRLLAPKG